MTVRVSRVVIAVLVASGWASGSWAVAPSAEGTGALPGVGQPTSVLRVDSLPLAPVGSTELLALPPLCEESPNPTPLAGASERNGLSLEELEQMALAGSPAIAVAQAAIAELRGKWQQAGLGPNPTAGYLAGEIGNQGFAGQQGGYVGQKFITAHKLRRSRAVVAAEIQRAQQQLAAMHQRVRTDVRRGYYKTLLAQRRVELATQLSRVAAQAVDASQSLYDAEEIPMAGLLQTEVQHQNAKVLVLRSRNRATQAWRELSAIVNAEQLPIQRLEGDVSRLPDELDWDRQLARLQAQSPEIAVAIVEVERARRALNRACAQATPDINTQLIVQYDDTTGDAIAGVQVGMPLPLWNRNQGGIRQARAGISKAIREVDRVENRLQQQLAAVFQDYSSAHATAQTYASEILPRSLQTFELVREGYEQGEVGYLDLLAAQRVYSQTNLAYLDALGELWANHCRIDGMLLEGSLGEGLR